MFLRYYCELPYRFEPVEQRLVEHPVQWLPGLAAAANRRGERLLAEVGFDLGPYRLGRQVEMSFRPPLRTPGRTVLPIVWRVTGPRALFPVFDGELEVAALGTHCTQLVISLNYRPPLGPVGERVDRFALHRVAEATIKDFLDRTGEALARPELASPAVGAVPSLT